MVNFMEKFVNWWQHIPEHVNPVLFGIGSFQVRYYGLMYIAGFLTVYLLLLRRIKEEGPVYTKETIQNYFIWAVPGLVIGARLGYVLFYDLKYFVSNPLEIILPFSFTGGLHYTGIYGMSYHGGLLGTLAATFLFARKYRLGFRALAEFVCPAVPLGYMFGRIGNFLNGELYGRITSVPWGMYFPLAPGSLLRHPSQLYEAVIEGVILFLALWYARKKGFFKGTLLLAYVILYGTARFILEFFREPDPCSGFAPGPFTTGQILCAAMIICGFAAMRKYRKRTENT